MLVIENYKSVATFLNNINALNLAGAIDRSVGQRCDGLLSAHATASVNWSVLTQRWPNKM
jgi:phosphatidate phosphatase PAH1